MSNSDTPRCGTPVARSTYNRLVRELERLPYLSQGAIDVPRGWIYVVAVLLRKIVALTRPSQDRYPYFRISRVRCSEHSRLHLDANSELKAVRGVLRKYMQRCAHTCQQCGVPGKRYQFGDRQPVLCAPCAAPALLLEDLVATQNRIAEVMTDAEVRLADLPPALRGAFADWVASREPEAAASGVPCWHLYEWLQRIEPLMEDLRQARDALTTD